LCSKGRYTDNVWAWRDKGSVRKEKGRGNREEVINKREQENADNCVTNSFIIRRPTAPDIIGKDISR
jgi:hypothetical protein